MVYRTIHDVKEAYARLRPGESWFSPDTMRWFNSRLMSTVYDDGRGGVYFVSSERQSPNRYADPAPPRTYTVRYMDDTGNIRDVEEFGHYRSRSGAIAAAKRCAAKAPKCQRMCGRDCAWDNEPGGNGDSSWFSWCSPCLMASAGVMTAGLPKSTCLHYGHTAGQLAPAYPSDGSGQRLGWVCMGFGADLCGRVFDEVGVELVYPRSYEVHADVGEGREVWEAGHPSLETAEEQARKWLKINNWRWREITLWVVEVFAEGPMKGQAAWMRAL